MPIMMTSCLVYALFLVFSACSLSPTVAATGWPTATTVRATQSALVATAARIPRSVTSPDPTPTVFSPVCLAVDGAPGARHTVIADLNYVQHSIAVQQTVHYRNKTGITLNEIVLYVPPNRLPNTFMLDQVSLADIDAGYELTGHRLTIYLPQPLPEECEQEIVLTFTLQVPPIGQGLDAYKGYFGYSPRQLNLGHWLPTVAVYHDDGWVIHPTIAIGEQNILDVADWDVTLSIIGAPESLQIAAPGEVTRLSDLTWRFVLPAARDFTLSMSDQFNVSRQQTESEVEVELYSFGDALVHAGSDVVLDAPARSLDVAVHAVAMYEDLFGGYAYDRLAVVQGDFPDGMEFTGLVFVSGDWFQRYDGTPAGYLVVITVHEVAHQWWYARVGSDAAIYPWLDEALATYSEYIFIEENFPDLKEWWWQWRVDRLAPQGFVDSTVYEFLTIRDYINAIYLRGVRMLHDLRQEIGTDAFFALLQKYAEVGADRLGTPELFWSLLTPEQYEQTRVIRARYLQQPDVLASP